MPVSVLVSITLFVLGMVGMLIFGGAVIILIALLGGGTVLALTGHKDSTDIKPTDLVKRKGLIERFGIGVVSVGMVGISGFGLAFVSIIGFILSIVVNLVIWIPTIFSSFG